MRMTIVTIAALVTVGFAGSASAQMSDKTRGELAAMRAQNATSYEACHSLAVQRGYSNADHEFEGRALMNFISGCMAMRAR
jgi:hypothetical protein